MSMTIDVQPITKTVQERLSMDTMTLINGDDPLLAIDYCKVLDNSDRITQPTVTAKMSQFPASVNLIHPETGLVVGTITADQMYLYVFSIFKDMMDNSSTYVEDATIAPNDTTGV